MALAFSLCGKGSGRGPDKMAESIEEKTVLVKLETPSGVRDRPVSFLGGKE